MEQIEWLYEGRGIETVLRNSAIAKCDYVFINFMCCVYGAYFILLR
jgi:hypothetical protein